MSPVSRLASNRKFAKFHSRTPTRNSNSSFFGDRPHKTPINIGSTTFRREENTLCWVKPFRAGGPCRVERDVARRFGEGAVRRKRGKEPYPATTQRDADGDPSRRETGDDERERDRSHEPKRRTPPEVPCATRFGAAAGRTASGRGGFGRTATRRRICIRRAVAGRRSHPFRRGSTVAPKRVAR